MASLATPTRRDSFSLETTEMNRLANMNLSFTENIHVRAPPTDHKAIAAAHLLKQAILQLQPVQSCTNHQLLAPIVAPANLQRILRARKFIQVDALELARETIEWRLNERPDLLRGNTALEKECCTGKARVGEYFDRHGRPMLLLDSAAENTSNATTQIHHLEWQMERLVRRMESSPNADVEKNCIFVNLERFSLWNCPPMKTTKATIALLSKFFCERMGHGICWQPPFYFSVFLKSVRPFVDPITYGKVVIIKGSSEPGSANDEKMIMLVGKDWRKKCQVDGEQQDKSSSPGYKHATYWPAAVAEEQAYFEAQERAVAAVLTASAARVAACAAAPTNTVIKETAATPIQRNSTRRREETKVTSAESGEQGEQKTKSALKLKSDTTTTNTPTTGDWV